MEHRVQNESRAALLVDPGGPDRAHRPLTHRCSCGRSRAVCQAKCVRADRVSYVQLHVYSIVCLHANKALLTLAFACNGKQDEKSIIRA